MVRRQPVEGNMRMLCPYDKALLPLEKKTGLDGTMAHCRERQTTTLGIHVYLQSIYIKVYIRR